MEATKCLVNTKQYTKTVLKYIVNDSEKGFSLRIFDHFEDLPVFYKSLLQQKDKEEFSQQLGLADPSVLEKLEALQLGSSNSRENQYQWNSRGIFVLRAIREKIEKAVIHGLGALQHDQPKIPTSFSHWFMDFLERELDYYYSRLPYDVTHAEDSIPKYLHWSILPLYLPIAFKGKDSSLAEQGWSDLLKPRKSHYFLYKREDEVIMQKHFKEFFIHAQQGYKEQDLSIAIYFQVPAHIFEKNLELVHDLIQESLYPAIAEIREDKNNHEFRAIILQLNKYYGVVKISELSCGILTNFHGQVLYEDRQHKLQTPLFFKYQPLLNEYHHLLYLLKHYESKPRLCNQTQAFLILPSWMAPIQARIIPEKKQNLKYAEKIYKILHGKGIRVEIDDREMFVDHRIQDAEREGIRFQVILSDVEEEMKHLRVRDSVLDSQTVVSPLTWTPMKVNEEQEHPVLNFPYSWKISKRIPIG